MFVIKPSALQLLVPLYNSPDRHYHNLNHIYYCLSKFMEINNQPEFADANYSAVEYAIWFHDAIYIPYPLPWTSNEQESLDLYAKWFITNGSEAELKTYHKAMHCIFATINHVYDLDNPSIEEKMMLDIDLAGFTKPFTEVVKDSDKILKEYECLGLPRQTMLENRVEFLHKLLNKTRIYYTEYFHKTYEQITRNNIESLIEIIECEIRDHIK